MNVSDIMADLADHGFTDTSTLRQMAVINDAYYDVCTREPWPFLEASIQLTFDGISSVPQNTPADLRAVLTVQPQNGPVINPIRYDDYLIWTGDIATLSLPVVFYFKAGVLNFYPTPPAGTILNLWYLKRPTALQSTDVEASILIPKEFHRALLVNGALLKLYAMEDDTDISPWFKAEFEQALQKMQEFCWKQQYDRPDHVHPADPEDIGWDILGI